MGSFYHFDLNFLILSFALLSWLVSPFHSDIFQSNFSVLFFIIIIVSTSLQKFLMSLFMFSYVFATVSFSIVIFESLFDSAKIDPSRARRGSTHRNRPSTAVSLSPEGPGGTG